jgi:hypothetical protein
MALHPEQRKLLERQHDFAQWQGADATDAKTIRNFALKGDELPGWALLKSRRNDALDPPRLDTFWRPAEGASETLLGIHVIERPTVAAAREALLGVLADVQSAAIVRRTDLPIGDVLFGQELMLVFARGNLVVMVRNAGPKVVPVVETAQTIDAVVVRALQRGE